ncbi:MAG TPA: hypothetical protein VJV75_08395 [Candidatus Polarisedimenticolia bacterium]|nr:hypothetical protein [Candidatus Polarisedimenticolia bacterium]
MKARLFASSVALGLLLTLAVRAVPAAAEDKPVEPPPKITIPVPGVPQIMNMEGRFVRAAYNNEGYAILGYRAANLSVGQKWILLDVGITVRDGTPEYTLTRDAITLETPDGQTHPMLTEEQYRKAPLDALEMRAQVQSDPINYFPPQATNACRLGFFADLNSGVQGYDQVSLNSQVACMGRLFFEVPAGIAVGQHWLNIKFAKSVVRVPFRILTKKEYKYFDKNYKDIEKQVEEAFRKQG